jgi:hypothetical protein
MLPGHPHRPVTTPLITIMPALTWLIKINTPWFFPKHKCALSKAGLTQINIPSRERI